MIRSRHMLHRALRGCGSLIVAMLFGCVVLAGPAGAHPSGKPFEIVAGSFHVTSTSQQAGAHEDLTTAFDFAHNGAGETFNDVRNTIVELPPGFIGSNTAVPTCSQAQLLSNGPRGPNQSQCPVASQVGMISFELAIQHRSQKFTVPLYNIQVTSPGIAAALGFRTALLSQILSITARPGDSGLTITSGNLQATEEPHNISVTVWGVPAAADHDAERDRECEESLCEGGNESAGIPPRPFLSTPTSCSSQPLTARLRADSWEAPETWVEETSAIPPMTGCERVPFSPSIVVEPTTRSAESSSGLNISLDVPQEWGSPNTLSTANVKDTRLALPVGYTANPSLAVGLGSCSPAQYEAETYSSLPGEGCPSESKIGAVEVETPVLVGGEKLSGAVYIAKPYDNPFDSLLGLYIIVKDPQLGIIVKLAGHIEPNPVTGQLVTTVNEDPQVPFSRFTLKLRQGAASPLVSPPACGTYTAEGALTPWSAPLTPVAVNSSFQIENGIGGSPCPAGGVPPFRPGLVAGTVSNSAGSYTPMNIHITRNDGEQEITRFSSILPAGLTAKLAGIPFCPDADIEAAKHVTGAQEEAEPSCPAASEIGHTLVGAGVGSVLAYTPGKVYMAGPYNGAPFSIAAITSAKVGPFDLGTVVVREALEIDPNTGIVTVDAKASDPIPHIIDGIVIHVRDIRVYIDRSQFMINPTSCDPMTFAATVDGAGADSANPADQVPVTIDSPFQLANCQNLAFKPALHVSTSGRTSRVDGASLSVKLTYPTGSLGQDANIKEVKVDLPKQLPSRLPTLQKACTEAQFQANPAGCPSASIVGHAKAITPILPVPLEGPAYFVSNGGAKWPELVIVLQGYGVTIDLRGETFISKQGVTSSTFAAVPDQPVTSFELTLPEGSYSALAAIGNLCTAKKLVMPTEFVAQNGDLIRQSTKIAVTGCEKKAKHAKSKKRRTQRRNVSASVKRGGRRR
jgi:hypothetical protein